MFRAGWEFLYVPDVVVEHAPSARGRHPTRSYWPRTMRNRAIIVRKYLPWWVAWMHVLIWGAMTGIRAAQTGGGWLWPVETMEGLRLPVQRRRLSWHDLRRLHRMGGRVFW
jgi:GT2 family glycosyltransferase